MLNLKLMLKKRLETRSKYIREIFNDVGILDKLEQKDYFQIFRSEVEHVIKLGKPIKVTGPDGIPILR